MIKTYLKIASLPIMLLALSLAYNLLWALFRLPKGDELIAVVSRFLETYGLWIVFVSAFVEGVLIAGNYFPGGLVVFLGVLAAGRDVYQVAYVVLLVSLAFACAYSLNYLIGKHGWYKLLVKFGFSEQLAKAEKHLQKHSLKAIISSYWHPNVGSLASTAAGVLKMDFLKFSSQSLPVLLFWNILWGVFVYYTGKQALNLALSLKYIIPIACVWILALWIKEKYRPSHGTLG